MPLEPKYDMGVTDDRFDNLLVRLEPVYGSSEDRYKQLRKKMIKFFAWRSCRDPESLADETIARLVKNIHGGQEVFSNNPYSYVYSIALNIYREYVREVVQLEAVLGDWEMAVADSPEEIHDCRARCLQGLSGEQLEMLKRYYLSGESGEEIAHAADRSINALRLSIYRIKCNLKDCHRDCVKGNSAAARFQ